MDKYFRWKVLLIFGVIGYCIYAAYPPQQKINLGLDLKGGMHILLDVQVEQIPEEFQEGAVDRAVEIIQNRIDQFGVREPYIAKQGERQIVVQLPGLTDQERAREIVAQTAHLEFKLVSDDEDVIKQALEGTVPENFEVKTLKDERGLEDTLVVEKEPVLTGDRLTNAVVGFDSYGQPIVEIQFDGDGAKIFDKVTFNNIGRRLAIVLDGKVHSAPVIRDRIPNGRGQISGNFNMEQASDTALVLNAGALPAPVTITQEVVVGPTLGKDSIRKGLMATAGGALLVFLFMSFYYLGPGWIACIAVFLNLVILMGVMAMTGASLSLPGIAGLILTMGMAVDANVLINERIREEKKLGKAVRSVISAGYHKAFTAILDSNVTTVLAAVILLWFGSGPVRGFAVTLSIGLAASMFTALFVTRVIFDYRTRGGREVSLKMFNMFPEMKFDWMSTRYLTLGLSALLVLSCAVVTLLKGSEHLGIDFTGGTVEEISIKKDMQIGPIREALAKEGITSATIQRYGETANNFLIRTKSESTLAIQSAVEKLVGEGQFEVQRSETLGPAAGKELFIKAVKALGIAMAIMFIYMAWRFHFRFSICAIIALLHDVIISIAVFVIAGREFSLPVLAAILTIVGYSVNDTIIMFDRIREDMKIFRKEPFAKVVNLGINQVFSRTIITSLTTLLVVVALFFFGGPALNDFSFMMIVGLLVGTYSSYFVACPILIEWNKRSV